jgi:serine protease AprX
MASNDERGDIPREFPAVEPEPDLAPDAAKPMPQGETPASEPAGVPAFSLPDMPTTVSLVTDSVITRPLAERMDSAAPGERIGIVIELRTDSGVPLSTAIAELELGVKIAASESSDADVRSTGSYVFAALTADEILQLVGWDGDKGARPAAGRQEAKTAPRSFINRVWPNFEVTATIHRSVITTKADAAVRAFDATGDGIVWAVLDTGIDAKHKHFATYETLDLPSLLAPRSFVRGTTDADALRDANGHGTHVAGIIAGGQTATPRPGTAPRRAAPASSGCSWTASAAWHPRRRSCPSRCCATTAPATSRRCSKRSSTSRSSTAGAGSSTCTA